MMLEIGMMVMMVVVVLLGCDCVRHVVVVEVELIHTPSATA